MTVTTKAQVMHLIEQHHQDLQRLGVHRCGLFGSFVRNAMTDQSDVDIWVEFEMQQKNFDNFMNLCFLLEEIFGRNFDLVTRESLRCLDVAFGEDTSRIRKDHAPRNMTLLRRLALNLLRREPSKGSLAMKRYRAGLDDQFLLDILAANLDANSA